MKENSFIIDSLCLAGIFTNLNNIFILLNLDGHIIEFNEIAEKYYGHEKIDIIDIRYIDFCKRNQFDIPDFVDNFNIIVQKGLKEFSQEIIHHTGQRKSAIWNVFPLYDSKYKLHSIALIGVEMTQKKNKENEIKSNIKQLENIIESVAGYHWWKDKNGYYLGCTNALIKHMGLSSAKDIIGKTDYDMPWAMEADQVTKCDQEIMENGLPQTQAEEIHFDDGRVVNLLVTKAPLRNEEGKIIGTVGTCFDITDQKNAKIELLIDKKRVEIKDNTHQAKSKFVNNINYKNTPLTRNAISLNLNKDLPLILLIEDDKLSQKVSTFNLEDLKCAVHIADSGQKAITMFQQGNYDLVITDLNLPDMDGFEIISALKNNEKTQKEIFIIALITYIEEQEKQDYIQAGVNDFFIKPLHMKVAKDILNKYFEMKLSRSSQNKEEVSPSTTHLSKRDSAIIDLNLGAKIIQKDQKAAKEMLDLLLKSLPEEQNNLREAYEKNDYSELHQIAHKLHGGSCYCGTPSLKFAAENLEKILIAEDKFRIKAGYELLMKEIDKVFTAYAELSNL